MNEFEKELSEALDDNFEAYPSGYLDYENCIKAIKQAVAKHIIGSTPLSYPGDTPEQIAYQKGSYDLVDKQRTKLNLN